MESCRHGINYKKDWIEFKSNKGCLYLYMNGTLDFDRSLQLRGYLINFTPTQLIYVQL